MTLEQNLENFSTFSYVPVTYLKDEQDIYHFPELELLPKLTTLVLSQVTMSDCEVQCIFTDELLCFGIIKVAEDNGLILFGPVTSLPCDNSRAQQILRRYGLPSTQTSGLLSYFGDTPKYSLLKFAKLLIYAQYIFNRKTIDIVQLLSDEYHEDTIVSRQTDKQPVMVDTNVYHDSQMAERKLFAAVKYGNLDKLNELLGQNVNTGNTGILASDNLRNFKNLVICSTTLASRAAVQGGLDYETAMRQADAFMQKVELAPDLKYLLTINHSMLRTYTRLVATRKIGNPDSTTATKIYNYVEQHIDTRIRVQQIADSLGLNRSYLCTQFKKETGMNLHDFISKAKVDQAKMLLTTTDNTCISIASTLDFSSQSHFQSTFKKYAGMTPKEYRKSNYF